MEKSKDKNKKQNNTMVWEQFQNPTAKS